MTAARGMLRLFALLLTAFPFVRSSFEPYQLNGGLVAAVAGKDYCVIASDTRLTDGGYEIYTRRHLTSRLWSVLDDEDAVCEPDGSLSISTKETTLSKPPVWIASSGCAADCEALKRNVRMEARASQYWNTEMGVQAVSTLLSQVLYHRRGFPYYSFCAVAGLSSLEEGAVFVYDAIGSFERVAVATAGTGRELLQPILDRLFSSPETNEKVKLPETTSGGGGTMPKVVETHVSCSADEAVSRLIRGFKSVAERDIGVGDSVVLCVTQRNNEDGTTTCRVLSVPLKTH